MNTLLILVILLTVLIIFLVLGMVDPNLILTFKNKKSRSRENAFLLFGIPTIILFILVIIVGLVVNFDSGNVEDNIGDTKDTEEKEETEQKPKEDKKKKTEYVLDEWWEVEDQWRLKIDSVSFTDERNQFSEKTPEAVVVIEYTYENLGYESERQDLLIIPDNVVDGEKKVVSGYPAGTEVMPKTTPVGAIMEGAEQSYGLTSKEGEINILFEERDDKSNKQKATFLIPLPSK